MAAKQEVLTNETTVPEYYELEANNMEAKSCLTHHLIVIMNFLQGLPFKFLVLL